MLEAVWKLEGTASRDDVALGFNPFDEGDGGVSTASGQFSMSVTDVSIETTGPSVAATRSYNSADGHVGSFGRGWTFAHDMQIAADRPNPPSAQVAASSSYASPSSGTSHTVTVPAGAVNDLVVLSVGSYNSQFNTPAGWTLLTQARDTTRQNGQVFWKKATTAGTENVALTATAATAMTATVVRLNNYDVNNPFDSTVGRIGSGQAAYGDVYTAEENTKLLAFQTSNFWSQPPAGQIATQYTGWTQLQEAKHTSQLQHQTVSQLVHGRNGQKGAKTTLTKGGPWSKIIVAVNVTPPTTPLTDTPYGATIVYPDGRREYYFRQTNGTYTKPEGSSAVLTEVSGGGWKLEMTSKDSFEFDAYGRITKAKNADGQETTYTYTATGGAIDTQTVTDQTTGRFLKFTYGAITGATRRHITKVETAPIAANGNAPYVWNYRYSGDLLVGVCDSAHQANCGDN